MKSSLLGCCLLLLVSLSTKAQEIGSIVQATSTTFACAQLEDATSISSSLNKGDDSKLKQLVAQHLCVNIFQNVPWQVQRVSAPWILISIPGLPGAAEWSPLDQYAAVNPK